MVIIKILVVAMLTKARKLEPTHTVDRNAKWRSSFGHLTKLSTQLPHHSEVSLVTCGQEKRVYVSTETLLVTRDWTTDLKGGRSRKLYQLVNK